MALSQELYATPASRLDSFVAQWLQPYREWKEEVLDAVRTVEQFLRQEHFQGEHGLDRDVRVLKVIKVGSFGNGTILRSTREVELVAFLSCFHSFQEAATHHQTVLRLIWKTMWQSQDLLALGLEDLRVEQRVPDALVLTIQTWQAAEPIAVTIVPAYRALGGEGKPSGLTHLPSPGDFPVCHLSLTATCTHPHSFIPSASWARGRATAVHRIHPTLAIMVSLSSHLFRQYVKARSPRANLPPLYALELLTIYAWEMGTEEDENFMLDEGFTTVMDLLLEYEVICIYWTKYYTLQNPVIEDCVRKQLKKERYWTAPPGALRPWNVASGGGQMKGTSAHQTEKCGLNTSPSPSSFQRARDIHVTVEQWGYPDFKLIVNPYEPIRKIKEKIRKSRGYSGLQRLSFQVPGDERQLLSSRSSLAKYGIFSHTHIYLLEAIPPEIQVFVKNPDGESYAYAIDPNSFVLGLKEQIEDQQGLPKKQQQLQFQGQVLQDWLSLGGYGVQDSDTLILSKKKAGEAPFPAS
nr:LOW QUALITY PROTEIN: 2'-5'-oligoadenylate synthase-like protein [Aotus nancymaae]